MEEVLVLVDGGDAVKHPAGGDGPAVPNGFPLEKDQTLTQTQEDDDDDKEDGSHESIKKLHQEIQGLTRDRSELQGKLEETLAEMERSEEAKKAIASHASYLEGELFRTQQDLSAVSSVAEDTEDEARGLRRVVLELEAENTSLKASKARMESLIRDLEEKLVAYGAIEADLAAVRDMESKREGEISALELKGRALEEQLKLSREEKEALEEKVKTRASRVAELEQAVNELKKMNSELEGRIGESSDLYDDKKKEEIAKGLKVSWAAAAAASTAAAAVAVTAIYLRHGRQR